MSPTADMAIIRLWVEAYNRRDLEGMIALTSPDAEFRPYLASLIETTTYRGHQGLRSYFDDADAAWEQIQLTLSDEFREVSGSLVGAVEIYGRGRTSRLEVRVPVSWVAEIRDAKIARLYAYASEAEALEEARALGEVAPSSG